MASPEFLIILEGKLTTALKMTMREYDCDSTTAASTINLVIDNILKKRDKDSQEKGEEGK